MEPVWQVSSAQSISDSYLHADQRLHLGANVRQAGAWVVREIDLSLRELNLWRARPIRSTTRCVGLCKFRSASYEVQSEAELSLMRQLQARPSFCSTMTFTQRAATLLPTESAAGRIICDIGLQRGSLQLRGRLSRRPRDVGFTSQAERDPAFRKGSSQDILHGLSTSS